MCAQVKDSPYVWINPHYELRILCINMLKWVGLWTLKSNTSSFLKCIYFIYNKIAVSAMIIFAVTLFTDICMMLDDLSIVTDDGCVFAGMFVVLFNVINCQCTRDKIARLSDETLNSCEELCQFSEVNLMEKLRYYLWRDKLPFYSFCSLGYLLVIALIFFASTEDGSLPIRARYPFDIRTSPGHEIGFVIEAFSIFFGVTAILAIDTIIVSICNLILLQLEILSMNFQHCSTVEIGSIIDKDNDNINKKKKSIIMNKRQQPDQFEKFFKQCIQHHQRLLNMINDLNDLFSSSMLVQMFSSTSMICLTGFQAIVVAGQDSNFWKYSIYLGAAISQLLYICWIGNEVITHSSSLVDAQWLSQWHNQPLDRTANLLIISSMFSQKPLKLKAGKFYILSLETFINIMKGSYSFFALLNTMHLEDHE
ncbi:PREDICTED: odorant receptor 85c-like [Polistes dominula]|uniref:Odorant receptor n=1 Tax=Polistes dominula TaxID=743375 RepID=A0ABM1IVY2_POLDO|nr:PREDICTED: odorant receptor 85c-like [Polistes dominula]